MFTPSESLFFQLISGSRVLDESRQSQHLLQWAVPLVESFALHDLIDPHLGDSYDMYGLYHLAKAAFLGVQKNLEMRPSIGEQWSLRFLLKSLRMRSYFSCTRQRSDVMIFNLLTCGK